MAVPGPSTELTPPLLGPVILRALGRVPERAMQSALLAEALLREPAGVVTGWLDRLIDRALGGEREARGVMVGVALDFVERRRRAPEQLRRLCLAAQQEGHRGAGHFLGDGTPARALLPRGRLAEVSLSATTVVSQSASERVELRPLEMRRIAREQGGRPGHHQIARVLRFSGGRPALLLHPDPAVVRQILRVPELLVSDVLLIASRRPTTAAIAHELASCDRWVLRPVVREALLQNPFTPPGLALSLAPTVSRRVLAHVASSAAFSAVFREAARYFLMRPDVRS